MILESTPFPGTTQAQVLTWLEEGSGLTAGTEFHLGYSPERIDPGNGSWTLAATPKIVSGIDDDSLAAVENFYQGIVDQTVPCVLAVCSRIGQADREHLPAREYRAGERAGDVRARARRRRVGGDKRRVHEAVRFHAVRSRPGSRRPQPAHRPLVPVLAGAADLGRGFRFVELANDINSHMPDYVVRRLLLALNKRGRPLIGSRILLLGLAYKKNTGDARKFTRHPRRRTAASNGSGGPAADPLVTESTVISQAVARVDATTDEIAAADMVVLLTDHDAFTAADVGRHARHVLDCRWVLSGANVEAYEGHGMTARRPTVLLLMRKEWPGYHSIERLFECLESLLSQTFDVRIVRVPCQSSEILRCARNLVFAARQRADIIHVTGDIQYCALALGQRKCVLTIHDFCLLDSLAGFRKRIFTILWYSLPLRWAPYLTTISGEAERQLKRSFPATAGKVRMIPNCVDKAFGLTGKTTRTTTGKPQVLQVGTGGNKNFERVCAAASGLPLRLRIIGALSDAQRSLLDSARAIPDNW